MFISTSNVNQMQVYPAFCLYFLLEIAVFLHNSFWTLLVRKIADIYLTFMVFCKVPFTYHQYLWIKLDVS